MSVDTLVAALNHSEARGTDRNVLVVLAEAADPLYGITWLPIDPPKWDDADPTKCITHRARCSKREAIRAIQALEQAGEIQVRKAQRGQRRISVYKVCVGEYARVEVKYDDLPFEIKEPFVTGCQIVTSYENTGSGDVTSRGDEMAPHEVTAPSPHGVTATRAREENPHRTTRVSAAEPSTSPSLEPAARPAGRHANAMTSAAAASSDTEPVSIERAVASLTLLNGWDTGSIRVVEPLLQQVPASWFARALETTLQRRARNPVGLFVHLLQTAINDWRRDQHAAALATWDALFGEAGIERVKREDPERYVLAWATPQPDVAKPLPAHAVVEHVFAYVHEYVADDAERTRLLELFVEAVERPPTYHDLHGWVLFAIDRDRRSLADVEALLRVTVLDDQERARLLDFAREIHGNVNGDEASDAA